MRLRVDFLEPGNLPMYYIGDGVEFRHLVRQGYFWCETYSTSKLWVPQCQEDSPVSLVLRDLQQDLKDLQSTKKLTRLSSCNNLLLWVRDPYRLEVGGSTVSFLAGWGLTALPAGVVGGFQCKSSREVVSVLRKVIQARLESRLEDPTYRTATTGHLAEGNAADLVSREPTAERRAYWEGWCKRAQEAESKAEALLESFLTSDQLDQWKAEKSFLVRGQDGYLYKVVHKPQHNVFRVGLDGQPEVEYCIVPKDNTPVGDRLLAILLLLRTNMEYFHKHANKWRLPGREPILEAEGF